MTDEHQEKFVMGALRIFVEYLNAHWDADPVDGVEPSPYTVEKFTITDPKKGLYGGTDWKVLEDINEEAAFPTGLIKIDTYDGDEGGGSQLYVGLQGHFNDDIRISWIVHIFDLMPTMIYNDEDGVIVNR